MRASARPKGQGGVIDIVMGVVALAAVGALGYVGVGWWTSQNAAPSATPGSLSPATVVTASLGPGQAWTEEDTRRCAARGLAAARAPMPDEMAGLANPAVTEGFANFATILACRITTKAARFCDLVEKAALVAMINDFVVRIDIVVVGLNVQGAPMSIMGEMMGGEIAAGSEIYDLVRDSTIDFMRIYSEGVQAGLQNLARGGVITVGDFGFMGMGVHSVIKEMLEGVERTGNLCA